MLMLLGSAYAAGDPQKKVLVVGIDGLDPLLLQRFMDEDLLPNFSALVERGHFKPLETSMPPLSPVAWSTFISGMDPGGHGIFDFIHRDPETFTPGLSMSRTLPPRHTVNLGSWVIPLTGGVVENLRRGEAFWQILEREADVPTTVFRMPANYPPAESEGKAFSGMGTPDILGTSGTFSFYTDRIVPDAAEITGGRVYPVTVTGNRVDAKLYGPKNSMRRIREETRSGSEPRYTNPDLTIDFSVFLDPDAPVAKLAVQDAEFILLEGEWSPWIQVRFDAIPLLAPVSAIGRFYLKQVRPHFELYVSPLQINPEKPALPIATPKGWSNELYRELGYFYTQELPEDTKAFSAGIFTGREFWQQSQFVFEERRRALDYFLKQFEEGFLFFYFSSIDQGCHMLWRYFDPEHPAYEEDELLSRSIETLYRQMDGVLGKVVQAIDDQTTLIVMSDHGFCPFYRSVNLNSWLLEKGYVTLKDPSRQGDHYWFANVDWSRTTAYAVGLNGLYVNLGGREKRGIVSPGPDYEKLLDRLERDLLEMRDPRDDQQAVTLVIRTHRDFSEEHVDIGPDIIVGYNWGYRSSWKSPLGGFPREVFVDNDDAWSGDHSVDYRQVPGVLISNREITLDEPALYDLTVAILDEYGIPRPDGMIGEDCLGPGRSKDRAGNAP
jgi:predicted AlkP superfamily phosphohydrolase/phosphomutase